MGMLIVSNSLWSRPQLHVHAAVLLVFFAATAGAATFTVSNNNDSGAGSLRQAILAVNGQSSGDHVISINGGLTIRPTSELDAVFYLPGRVSIEGNGSTIDGTDIIGEGGGLLLWTSGSVRNLSITNFPLFGLAISAGNCTVTGCRIGTDNLGTDQSNGSHGIIAQNATNLAIGSTNSGDANWILHNGDSGIVVANSSGVTIRGNLIGFNRTGVSIDTLTDCTIGGGGASGRNVIVGNLFNGIRCISVSDCLIASNFVGLDGDGFTALGNGLHGIYLYMSTNNTIGGDSVFLGNVLCDNAGSALYLEKSDGNHILGNYMGASPWGKALRALIIGDLGNAGDGITIADGSTGNTVGGANPGEPNLITDNEGAGVRLTGASTRLNALYENAIFGNKGGEIVLQDGANDGILPPVITGINPVSGTASAAASVEIFAAASEGQRTFVGKTVADGGGDFTLDVDLTAYGGMNLTATQTVDGNTSALSDPYPVPATGEIAAGRASHIEAPRGRRSESASHSLMTPGRQTQTARSSVRAGPVGDGSGVRARGVYVLVDMGESVEERVWFRSR